MIPSNLRYHQEHEWVRAEGAQATVGISHFAQDALGDIVFYRPSEGRRESHRRPTDRRSGIDQNHVHDLYPGQRNRCEDQ
jgi:hypothetical protein